MPTMHACLPAYSLAPSVARLTAVTPLTCRHARGSAAAAAAGSQSRGATDNSGGDATEHHDVEVEISYLNRLVRVPHGTTLRTALLEAGLTPHNGQSKLINCR